MSLQPDDRVLVKPLGVKGTVVRAAALRAQVPSVEELGVARWVVRADCSTQDVVWAESELEKL